MRQDQRKNTAGKQGPKNERKPKRKHDEYKGGDDAPRAFKRLMAFAGGATTRWSVERRTSLLQRARRSPALMTIVPGYTQT